MRSDIFVGSDDFLVFTKPADFTDPEARSYAASHAASFGSRKEFKPVKVRPDGLRNGCHTWKVGTVSLYNGRGRLAPRRRAGSEQRHEEGIKEKVPMSLPAHPSLQNCMAYATILSKYLDWGIPARLCTDDNSQSFRQILSASILLKLCWRPALQLQLPHSKILSSTTSTMLLWACV